MWDTTNLLFDSLSFRLRKRRRSGRRRRSCRNDCKAIAKTCSKTVLGRDGQRRLACIEVVETYARTRPSVYDSGTLYIEVYPSLFAIFDHKVHCLSFCLPVCLTPAYRLASTLLACPLTHLPFHPEPAFSLDNLALWTAAYQASPILVHRAHCSFHSFFSSSLLVVRFIRLWKLV